MCARRARLLHGGTEHKDPGARASLVSEEQQGFQQLGGALMRVKAMSRGGADDESEASSA